MNASGLYELRKHIKQSVFNVSDYTNDIYSTKYWSKNTSSSFWVLNCFF